MQPFDEVIEHIADYTDRFAISNEIAYETAWLALADSLGCAILSLKFPECTKLLGPIVPGTSVPSGSRIPGTKYILDPVCGAFNIGIMIRWLDFNDTWLAEEWGHPSDNIGGILALSDYLSRTDQGKKNQPFMVKDLLTAIIVAYEIQGVLALKNSFNKIGLDHVILVKVASAAVATKLMGGDKDQIASAVSQAWIDIGPLRTYRHAPNTGSRKSWAAGDATSRGVYLAWLTMRGEKGYRTALSTTKWGFYDALLDGKPLTLQRSLDSYVMENILFKVSYPAEFHSQTALECAIKLHPLIQNKIDNIDKIEIYTHSSAIKIIDKKGPLHNPSDRDHCLQYVVAIGLLKGNLIAEDYEDLASKDLKIDHLRSRMVVVENDQYSKDYLDPDKRSIASSVQIYFRDGSSTEKIVVEYPLGHKKRRKEAIPLLYEKLRNNLKHIYSKENLENLMRFFQDPEDWEKIPVSIMLDLFEKT